MTSSYSLVSAPFQITQLEPLSSEGAVMPRTLAHFWTDDNALQVNCKPTLSGQ